MAISNSVAGVAAEFPTPPRTPRVRFGDPIDRDVYCAGTPQALKDTTKQFMAGEIDNDTFRLRIQERTQVLVPSELQIMSTTLSSSMTRCSGYRFTQPNR